MSSLGMENPNAGCQGWWCLAEEALRRRGAYQGVLGCAQMTRQLEEEKAALLERKRQEQAERRRKQEELDRILADNRRKARPAGLLETLGCKVQGRRCWTAFWPTTGARRARQGSSGS